MHVKRTLFLLLFINICTANFCQLIKGYVLDRNSKEPINFASVYFNGTFSGTHTDKNGYFELDVSRYRSMPLSVSALGYYTVTISDFIKQSPLMVFMEQKVFELQEVTISEKSNEKARERNLRVFKDQFLGKTLNAMHCIIINERNIKFNYYSDKDSLIAYSDEPMVVENLALGYRITYFLDDFELERKTGNLFFAGNIFFEEDLTALESEKHLYERKRRNAYLGSRMHFIRTLWANKLDQEGFVIMDQEGRKLKYNDVVIEGDGLNKYLEFDGKLVIYYQTNEPWGTIKLKEETIFLDKSGYFDPFTIVWEGNIAKQRIGDWLPYEYELTTH
jgi:hypothetical protein